MLAKSIGVELQTVAYPACWFDGGDFGQLPILTINIREIKMLQPINNHIFCVTLNAAFKALESKVGSDTAAILEGGWRCRTPF